MKKKQKLIKIAFSFIIFLAALSAVVSRYLSYNTETPSVGIDELPPFTGAAYVILNDNVPSFDTDDMTTASYEFYSELDAYNRCGYAMACIGKDLMPDEERGSIGQVKPSGWQTEKYEFIDGKYLYNRCHLIGYQLTGENANECNLITGTRYLNMSGMLPFENQVADYVDDTGNHVLYRVTPIFHEDETVARGVQMEAFSVEDDGRGICFNVYAYNCQPGVTIDYNTGESYLSTGEDNYLFVLNTATKKFHLVSCGQGNSTKPDHKEYYTGTRESLLQDSYIPAGCCEP